MEYSETECVFIVKYYFIWKQFPVVREAFSNAFPDKEVPNKTTIRRLAEIKLDNNMPTGGNKIRQQYADWRQWN
jgi:hypothetical protein